MELTFTEIDVSLKSILEHTIELNFQFNGRFGTQLRHLDLRMEVH